MAGESKRQPTAEEWIGGFAAAAGSEPPTEAEVVELLKLAAVAAHSSERTAAPIACWIAGRVGLDLAEAIAMAERAGGAEA